jgi:hypothetical protein
MKQMEIQKPDLPLSLKVIGVAAKLMNALELLPTRLDEDSVCEAAVKAAGLTDLGDPYFREGFLELLRSCQQDADLHPIGRMVARDMVTNFLIQRLKLVEARKQQPEIFLQPLRPPLIITGMARSGTTFLHNLLASDPANRAIPQWQLMRPFPESDADPDAPDPRIAKMESALKFRQPMLPGLDSKHPLRADAPEECIIPLAITFNSLLFPTLFPVKAYMHWYLENADSSLKYQEYKWILQVFQAEQPGQQLTMKAPAHMGSLGSLIEHVPEALIIQLHRDPATCLSSACSLIYTYHQSVSDHVDINLISDLALQLYETWLRKNLAFRTEYPNLIYDVFYPSFVSDPVGTVRQIYSHFDLPWTESIDASLRAYIDRNPKNKHGTHHYSAADFGYSEAAIADRLKFFYGEVISI